MVRSTFSCHNYQIATKAINILHKDISYVIVEISIRMKRKGNKYPIVEKLNLFICVHHYD